MRRVQRRRAKGSGSITQQGDVWFCRIDVSGGVGPKRYKTFNAKSKVEGNKWLQEQATKMSRGQNLLAKDPKLADYLDDWLGARKPEIRPSTYRSYQLMIKHIKPTLGQFEISKIKPAQIRSLLAEKEKEGHSANTRRLIRVVLFTAFRQAFDDDLIAVNPVSKVKAPKVEHKSNDALCQAEALKLLEICRSSKEGLLPHFLILTGVRKGEALGLMWEDVDFENGFVEIAKQLQYENGKLERTVLKTNSSRRVLPLDDEIVERLKKHQREQEELAESDKNWKASGFVFTSSIGTPLDPRKVNRILNEFLVSAKLRHVRVHDLRHTHATLSLESGADLKTVSDALGHSQIGLTANTYIHKVPKLQRDAANRLSKMLQAKEETKADSATETEAVKTA